MRTTICYIHDGEELLRDVTEAQRQPVPPSKGDIVQLKGVNYEVKILVHKFPWSPHPDDLNHRILVIMEKHINGSSY